MKQQDFVESHIHLHRKENIITVFLTSGHSSSRAFVGGPTKAYTEQTGLYFSERTSVYHCPTVRTLHELLVHQ